MPKKTYRFHSIARSTVLGKWKTNDYRTNLEGIMNGHRTNAERITHSRIHLALQLMYVLMYILMHYTCRWIRRCKQNEKHLSTNPRCNLAEGIFGLKTPLHVTYIVG